MEAKELILNTVDDLVADFLYYGRKEDEELPVGEIEKNIETGNITVEEIVAKFESCLREALDNE